MYIDAFEVMHKHLHKGRSKKDPNFYSEIYIMSCLGKLVISVLTTRLAHKLNTDFQIGFASGSRPSDHMLTHKTISDKFIGQGKKGYCCFLDFKKAFDTVWHNGLLFKAL